MRKLIAAVVAGLALALAMSLALPGALLVSPTPDPLAPLPAGSHTPAELEAAHALAVAIRDAPPDAKGFVDSIRRNGDLPDIEVSGSTATVYTAMAKTEAAGAPAMFLCMHVRSLAAKVRGIEIVVIAGDAGGREVVSTCNQAGA
jgi:hypothetical protein